MQLPTIDPYLLLWIEWSVASMLGLVTGFIVLKYADLAPDFMHRIVKYGKTAERYDKYHIVELPKRYFNHFYSVALVFYTFLATVAFDMYFNLNLFGDNAHESPSIFVRVLELFNKNEYLTPLGGHLRTAACAPESVMIGLTLLIMQVSRRLYECTMISVYSNGNMNIAHYMMGHFFYIGVGLSMLAEAPGFAGQTSSTYRYRPQNYEFVTPCHVIGIILFLCSSYIQFDSHRVLANLRKDSAGRIVTTKHSIPRGFWFNLVSSPHYMAEIMIYLSLTIVLGGKSLTWWMVFLFVITNQTIAGIITHSWYNKTFKDYPQSRLAIIPYVL